MSRTWFAAPLETVATWWRVYRKDGVTFGFTSHDRDLRFGGISHKTAPGMIPSAIRLTSDLQPDSAEIAGALDHRAITAKDLAAGRFDGARVEMGLVDWETFETQVLYAGSIGSVSQDGPQYSADLVSQKAELLRATIPRTSPTCRAEFCGKGCNLSPAFFTHDASITSVDLTDNAVTISADVPATDFLDGSLVFLGGVEAGAQAHVAAIDGTRLILDRLFDEGVSIGDRVEIREGCDRRWATCKTRFANAVNFRAEPFLPGNDLLTRYPSAP